MTLGKSVRLLAVPLGLGLVLGLAACSSSSSDDPNAIRSVLQDLTLDASGRTTVITFRSRIPATAGPGNFEANGGQLAMGVTVAGDQATVVWDERVTPSHRVRPVGLGVGSDFVQVATSDAAPPTFAITFADQTPGGLGGDTIEVQFAGAHVVEAAAEDLANWTLTVDGVALDLAGSTFAFEPLTQAMTVTLGAMANLHASFELAAGAAVTSVADVPLSSAPVVGVATGDTTAPVLLMAEQNLAEDEYGRVVDFTFSEAMDPVFSHNLFSFDPGFPVFATQVEQPSDEVLRVTFTQPVIPGVDQVDLTSLLDAHGNAFADNSTPIAAGSTVANGFGALPAVTTVENFGGDTIVATLLQAIDPATAEEPGRWMLESPTGSAIDLSTAEVTYDFTAKTITVVLQDEDLVTGDSFTFGSSGPGTGGLDVDGEDFVATAAGMVAGDAAAPGVASVLQNRQLDPTGRTFEVRLTEDVEPTAAETPANYAFSNGALVQTATLLAGQDVVRLTLDVPALPGTDTVDVQSLVDLAGNAMALVAGNATTSSDTAAPAPVSAEALAVEGADDDTVSVVFDDDMVESQVTDLANWTFQSPVGNVVSPLLGTITWDAGRRTAVLTLTGTNLRADDDFAVEVVDAQDLGGNVVDAAPLSGPVAAETRFPSLVCAWVEDAPSNTNLHVRFDEPCEAFDPAGGATRYVIRDSNGLDVGGGIPVVTPDADGLGATLSFALAVVPGFHTLDVRGVTDLAGNQMFALEAVPIVAEDPAEPALELGMQTYLAVPGERNDLLSIVFDRQVSPWGLLDPANYSFTDGVTPLPFGGTLLSFDGDRTVTAELVNGYDLDNGAYTLSVQGAVSIQGVPMTAPSVDTAAADPLSDASGPNLVAARTRLDAQAPTDSVLVEFDEAVHAAEAVDVTNYSIGGLGDADSVVLVDPRTARATWNAGVLVGQTVDVTMADLATNTPGLQSQLVQAADTAGPAVSSIAGTMVPGVGGDRITVAFNQPVGASALASASYAFSVLGTPLDLTGALLEYDSTASVVTITLPDDFDFQVGDSLNAVISGVVGAAGIPMSPPANVNGAVGGDATPPSFVTAFVNLRAHALGQVVDVLLSEDVDPASVAQASAFEVLDGMGMPVATTVTGVEVLRPDALRLTLSAPLAAGEAISVADVADMAGNLASPSVTPLH